MSYCRVGEDSDVYVIGTRNPVRFSSASADREEKTGTTPSLFLRSLPGQEWLLT